MSTDTADSDTDRMEKVDVRVPAAILEEIDETYVRRGYTSRSEAIRDALRDWVDPEPELTEEAVEAIVRNLEQPGDGERRSLSDVADDFGVEFNDG
jgi:metal-responsive CopG/Arc/MetJ family transcriptional regulator